MAKRERGTDGRGPRRSRSQSARRSLSRMLPSFKAVQPLACRTLPLRQFNPALVLRSSSTAAASRRARPSPPPPPPPVAVNAVFLASSSATQAPPAKMTKVDRSQQNAAHAAKIQRDFRT